MKPANIERGHQQRYINTLIRLLQKKPDNEFILFSSNDERQDKSAIYSFVMTSLLLQDKELDDILSYMLHDKCCKNDLNFHSASICSDDPTNEKRNTIKKVKFHSWGGKRSDSNAPNNVRSSTNVDFSKDSGSKIVIRTPFRPWGGKRQSFE